MSAEALAELEEFCGEPIISVETFVIEHGGHTYALPRNVEIYRSGMRIYADREPSTWMTPLAGVSYASSGPDLLIRTFDQDCVDLYQARLFIIAPDGSVVQQPIWTSFWKDGFFEVEEQLRYWSEWFCHEDNPDRVGDATFVYAYSTADRSFSRIPADRATMCAEDTDIPFLEFRPAEAVLRRKQE